MAQCPNCHSEVKDDERFCGNCGARLEQSTPPRPTGKETIVLPKITDLGMSPPAPPSQPPADATIVAPPAPPSQPPADATIVGGTPGLPPSQPPAPPPPQVGGAAYTGAGLPGAQAVPSPAQKSGSNIWKILAIIAGIGVVACVALAIGAYLLFQQVSRQVSSSTGSVFATVNAGLETAAAAPSLEPLATIEAAITTPQGDATSEPATTGTILFRDGFDDPQQSKFDEDEDADERSRFVDGAYAITVKTSNLTFWKTLGGRYSNAAVSVDTKLDGPTQSATGLVFRSQDNKNFYIFTVAGDSSYALDLYKDDKRTTLIDWTDSPAINGPGESNRLRIETVGDTIRLFVNGQLLEEIRDSTFADGKIGIAVSAFDKANVTVKFDNLVVQGVE